jgi:hypothetical protein
MTTTRFALPLLWALTVSTGLAANRPPAAPTAVNAAASPSTTNNDDGCDIAVMPAATLLLPYFEVDFTAPSAMATTTLFSVTNVSKLPQIAHVTVWTDWSYPLFTFNVFLTGYDVQTFNLYDVIAQGALQPTTAINPAGGPSPVGPRSGISNPNLNVAACNALPASLGASLTSDVQSALTTGIAPGLCASTRIGSTHAWAIGYLTIDVVSACTSTFPTNPAYYSSEILFDNVLYGDYQSLARPSAGENYASGGSMVHIRASPEGGAAGQPTTPTLLPFTFYDRYTPAGGRTMDRRQPLPASFAARFIQGGATAFTTNFKIWREGVNNPGAACNLASANSAMTIADVVRFDEHENATTVSRGCDILILCTPRPLPSTPASLIRSSSDTLFPPMATSDVGGWMYFNLNNFGSAGYSAQRNMTAHPPGQGTGSSVLFDTPTTVRPSQGWLIYSMHAEGRLAAEMPALALGNGCSLVPGIDAEIGPTGGLISPAHASGNTNP